MSETFGNGNDPFTRLYTAVCDYVIDKTKGVCGKTIRFDEINGNSIGSTQVGDVPTLALVESGLNDLTFDSQATYIKIGYELWVNTGSNLWTGNLSKSNWSLFVTMCKLRRESANLSPYLSDCVVQSSKYGMLAQQTQTKINLPGWNAVWNIEMSLCINNADINAIEEI